MARDAGVHHVIGSDAHRVNELDFIRFGVDQARRGWCTARDIANTLPCDELLGLLETRPRARASRHATRAAQART